MQAPQKKFTLAMIQMRVDGGAPEANLARATDWIEKAALAGADVVLLPEAMNLGWTHPSAADRAETLDGGPTRATLQRLAERHQILICAGFIERDRFGIYNSAMLIDKWGKVLLHHRKINDLTIALPYYTMGNRLLTAPTPFGRAGLMICADGFAPDLILSRSLAHMGADFILSPCAWAVVGDHDNAKEPYGQLWRDCYGTVAKEYQIWIAGVSNVGPITAGPWAGRNCIGCSLAVGPDGEVAAQGSYGVNAEEMILLEITPRPRPASGNGWRCENE